MSWERSLSGSTRELPPCRITGTENPCDPTVSNPRSERRFLISLTAALLPEVPVLLSPKDDNVLTTFLKSSETTCSASAIIGKNGIRLHPRRPKTTHKTCRQGILRLSAAATFISVLSGLSLLSVV